MLSYQQRQLMDELAPTHLTVPSGSRIPIDYSGEVPVLAVRLQEMFGLCQTPTVAGGRQPLLIHLLSPAGRSVQITQDLAGFWQTGYSDVKKELKGRYPKHYWPNDPLRAQATARVRPRGGD
jgi:ATP-dependent helicase HrpB